MFILARNAVTGTLTLIESAIPRDVALDLGAGAYEVLPVGDIIGSVNVLDVAFATAPLVSGSATAGATLTVSGTATAAVAYEYQWLADGVLIPGATNATYATDAAADLGKTFTGQMRAQDARGRWTAYAASSNSITIPAAAYTIPDEEWTAVEDPDDAETRQTYVTATPTVPVPTGKKLRWYKGRTNPTDSSMFVFLSDMVGTGPYTADGVSLVGLGAVVYSRLAISNLDNTSPEWVTSIKNYTTSNVPSAPGEFTATNSTTVTGRVSLDPNNTPPATNGRAILEYGYSQNGGTITPFASGGTAVTARDVDFAGIDPIAIRLHARNANGWSVGSASVSVTPPVITGGTNTVAPSIESNFYGQSQFVVDTGEWTGNVNSFVVDIEKSDDGATGWTTHAANVLDGIGEWPQTTLDTKYVRAKVTPPVGSPVYSAVSQMKNSPTHVLHFQNDALDYTVAAPLWGASLTTGGVWFSYMFYYTSGTNVADGWAYSFTAPTSANNQIAMNGVNGYSALSGTNLQMGSLDVGGQPADPQGQWYIMTLHWYAVGSVHYLKMWRNDLYAISPGATRTFTLAGATAWTAMRLGGPQTTGNGAVIKNLRMCGFMSGTGNPEQFHIATFNEGKFANPLEYDFATDANGATKNFGVEGFRVGAATFDNTQIPDVVGSAGTPTAIREAPTWADIPPPFVRPTGKASPVQAANIRPLYAPAGTQQSLQYGYGKMLKTGLAGSPWATATSYTFDQRVTQGGSTYICVTEHTAGTFATDLAAGNWAIYTINSLSHVGYAAGDIRFPAGSASLGDILPTVVNGIYTCTVPGTITASVTCGKIIAAPAAWLTATSYSLGQKVRTGTPEVYYECTQTHTSGTFSIDNTEGYWKFIYGSVNIVSHLYEPQTMPANPRNTTDYDGNGLLCSFDPYPTPVATGTTFATASALASAISAIGPGGYLCVNDLTDTGTDLYIPAGDYAGAVVEAKNLHGVQVKDVFMYDVRNLVVRGFKGERFKSGGNDFVTKGVRPGMDGVWVDHCHGRIFDLGAKVKGVSRCRVSNWQSPNDGTATMHIVSSFLEALIFKTAIAGSGPNAYGDRLFLNRIDRVIADRVYVGPWGGTVAGSNGQHADLIQVIYSGPGGFFGGYFINSAAIDRVDPLTLPSSGAFFADGNTRCKDFLVSGFMGRDRTAQSISFSNAVSNCSIENSYGKALVGFKSDSKANSCYTDNNVRGASGSTLASPAMGTDLNTISLISRGISASTVFPQYDIYPLSWRAFANPAVGYTGAGPATFIAELEAKRVALGI